MENEEVKIQELLNFIEGDALDEKMQYLIYESASGKKMSAFAEKLINDVNYFFSNLGDEGTDFERYLDFTKINILIGNMELARSLISEIEKELEKNFMLPNGDIFSIYQDVAIMEAMASTDPVALDYINDVLSLFPTKDGALVPQITEVAMTVVDTIHLNSKNFKRVQIIKNLMEFIPTKKEKDTFKGLIARKMVMRDEFNSSLNEDLIYFAENELYNSIEDRIEKIFTASQIAIAKIMLGRTEKNEKLVDEGESLIEFIKNFLPKNSSKVLKLFRDITLFKTFTLIGNYDGANILLNEIKNRVQDFLRIEGNDDEKGGVIYFLVSSLFLRKFENESDYKEFIELSDMVLNSANYDVKLWSYIDISTSLAKIGKTDESLIKLKNAENYIEFFNKEDRTALIDDVFSSAISENYLYTSYEKFIEELINLLKTLPKEDRADIASEFFYNLAMNAVNRKMGLSLNI